MFLIIKDLTQLTGISTFHLYIFMCRYTCMQHALHERRLPLTLQSQVRLPLLEGRKHIPTQTLANIPSLEKLL